MDTCDVLLPKSVNPSNFKYSTPKTLSNGSRTVYITHNSQKLSIQTPIMRLPYGVGEGYESAADKEKEKDENKKPPSYDLHVSFGGHDENPKMKNLLDTMLAIETQVKQDAFNNRVQWLDDDFDGIEQVVNKLFTPIVKYDKDKQTKKVIGKYPPTMKLKLPYDVKTSKFQFQTEDMDNNVVDFKMVQKNLRGGRGKFIIQLSGLWFAGGKFGCTWKVVNAKVEGTVAKALKFIEDSDDENEKANPPPEQIDESDDDLAADAISNANANPNPKIPDTTPIGEDDDDDADADVAEEEEEEEDDEPPPPPPPKKTPAKKAPAKK